MRVRRLAEDDWRQLQGIRLRSLTEDHPVLGSVEREQGFRESHWRMRIRGSAWFVATHRRRTVGIASVIAEPGTPVDERHVVGLWVAPEARGTTAWAALLDAAADLARAEGASRLTAWCLDGDDVLAAALRDGGFAPTGIRVPVPRDRSLTEERWVRELAGEDAG